MLRDQSEEVTGFLAAQLKHEVWYRSQESFLGHPRGLQVTWEKKLDEAGKPAARWGLAQLCVSSSAPSAPAVGTRKQWKGKSRIHGVCLCVCRGAVGEGKAKCMSDHYLW